MTYDAEHKQPAIRAQQKKAQQVQTLRNTQLLLEAQQSLTSTAHVVSLALLAKPAAMVSATSRGEKPQRIRVGSNLSEVQRALKSGTFKPLQPADKDEFEKIVDKSIKSAKFKPAEYQKSRKPLSEMGLEEREALYESSKPHKTD